MFSSQTYQGPNVTTSMQQRRRTIKDIIPTSFFGLLGTFQIFLWIIIIVLEIMSIYYDAGRGTIYAGLWCSIVFFVTWVSMFCYLCCGKLGGCGRYLFVQNIINLFFSIVLVGFTARFVENPCLCYGILCHIPNWDSLTDPDFDDDDHIHSCTSRTYRKLPILKGLLACAVLMLLCNIVFIVTYLIVTIQVRMKAKSDIHTPDVTYQQQSGAVHWSEQPSYASADASYPSQQYQHRQLYPNPNTQIPSPYPSAPPAYEMSSEKF